MPAPALAAPPRPPLADDDDIAWDEPMPEPIAAEPAPIPDPIVAGDALEPREIAVHDNMVVRVMALILSQPTCLLRLVQWCQCHWRATGPAHLKASNSSELKDAEEDGMISLLDSL